MEGFGIVHEWSWNGIALRPLSVPFPSELVRRRFHPTQMLQRLPNKLRLPLRHIIYNFDGLVAELVAGLGPHSLQMVRWPLGTRNIRGAPEV